MPARGFGDNQVLRLADHRHYAAERGGDPGVHHQAAQEAAKLLQNIAIVLLDMAVVEHVVIVRPRRSGFVINTVEANGYADHDGDNGQRVEEGGEESGRDAKRQRQQHLAANAEQQTGEDEQQQLLHEVDTRHHKHQQQQDFKITGHFFANMPGRGHTDKYRFNSQQAARQQRITFKRHKRMKIKDQRINDQENDESEFVPVRGLTKKVAPQGAAIRHFHDRHPFSVKF